MLRTGQRTAICGPLFFIRALYKFPCFGQIMEKQGSILNDPPIYSPLKPVKQQNRGTVRGITGDRPYSYARVI